MTVYGTHQIHSMVLPLFQIISRFNFSFNFFTFDQVYRKICQHLKYQVNTLENYILCSI
jgi:hypothetical protein